MELNTKKLVIMILAIVSLVLMIPNLLGLFVDFGELEIAEELAEQVEQMQVLSTNAQVACYMISGIASLFILILNRNLIKNKPYMLLFAIFATAVGNPLTFGAMIIILCIKTKGIDETVTLPEVEETVIKHKIAYFIFFTLIFILGYTIIPTYVLDNIQDAQASKILGFVYMIISILCIVLPVIVMGKQILGDLKLLKKNFKTYLSYIAPRFGIFILIYFVVAIIINLIVPEGPTNQEMVEELPIWKSALMSLLYAPLVEESFFRGFLKRGIKNSKVFVMVSALVFGLAHIAIAEENMLVYLYAIIYVMLGYFFANTYHKTNNIVSNMLLHFLWNSIGVISMILTAL